MRIYNTIGFTGTRDGMTDSQKKVLAHLLYALGAQILHHGDCIGADEDAHNIARENNVEVVIHPPTVDGLRAFCLGASYVHRPRPYHERNRAIVDDTEFLIATPAGDEVSTSGTWSTIRYARKHGKPLAIIMPDGSTKT